VQTTDRQPETSELQEAIQESAIEDIQTRIAAKVRDDSEHLARPIVVDSLEELFTELDPQVDFAEMVKDERYQDIQLIVAPAGTLYIYSDVHITPEEAVEKSALEEAQTRIAEIVREDSRFPKLTGVDHLDSLFPELQTGERETDLLSEMGSDDRYQDIHSVTAATGAVYVYSETYMTRNYAELLVRMEAKDPLVTISETVREESRVYPRPTAVELFREPIFDIGVSEIETHIADMLEQPEYKDIKEVVASNGARYLYSDLYMSEALARSTAEWLEVEQYENP
jgi:hypothetical protein